jgi:hypothetical protein
VSDNCFICETPDDGTTFCNDCGKALGAMLASYKGEIDIIAFTRAAVRRARKFERARAAIERGAVVRALGESRMSAVKP